MINNDEARKALFGLVEENGAVPLAIFDGFRQITNNKRPINTIEDMLDLKIRVPGMSMYIDLV